MWQEGKKQGGLHLQLTLEAWDVASISERTAIDHLKKKLQAVNMQCSRRTCV